MIPNHQANRNIAFGRVESNNAKNMRGNFGAPVNGYQAHQNRLGNNFNKFNITTHIKTCTEHWKTSQWGMEYNYVLKDNNTVGPFPKIAKVIGHDKSQASDSHAVRLSNVPVRQVKRIKDNQDFAMKQVLWDENYTEQDKAIRAQTEVTLHWVAQHCETVYKHGDERMDKNDFKDNVAKIEDIYVNFWGWRNLQENFFQIFPKKIKKFIRQISRPFFSIAS